MEEDVQNVVTLGIITGAVYVHSLKDNVRNVSSTIVVRVTSLRKDERSKIRRKICRVQNVGADCKVAAI